MDNGAQTHLHSVTRTTSSTTSTNIKTWRVATGKHSSTCMQVSQPTPMSMNAAETSTRSRGRGRRPPTPRWAAGRWTGGTRASRWTSSTSAGPCSAGTSPASPASPTKVIKKRHDQVCRQLHSKVLLHCAPDVHGWPCLHSHLLIHKSHCNIQTKCIQLLGQVTAAPAWQDILI